MAYDASNLAVSELTTRSDIADSFTLMKILRERIVAERYVDEVERQRREGYRLFGGRLHGELVALIGLRHTHTLSRGEHIFIDDLIVLADKRAGGVGRAMMEWLGRWSKALGVPRIYLDSRDTAKGFYARLGFTFLTSIPCWITPEEISGKLLDDVRGQ